jgi:hypothetical protein
MIMHPAPVEAAKCVQRLHGPKPLQGHQPAVSDIRELADTVERRAGKPLMARNSESLVTWMTITWPGKSILKAIMFRDVTTF